MKKNILIILSALIIIILVGCQKKEEVSTYEQDRVAQYILDNVELVDGREIKKIKFLSFEKPNTMNLSENKLGDKLSIIYSDKEVKYISKERERRKIEIVYLKEK